MLKKHVLNNKGMMQDLDPQKANPGFAFENVNIRLDSTDGAGLLGITNEKGNIILDTNKQILGTLIGNVVVDNEIVLFTTDSSKDRIYRVHKTMQDDTQWEVVVLYEGNLSFNINNPIDAVSLVENDNIKKVYWTDGINQPRVINIEVSPEIKCNWHDHSFDFVPTINYEGTHTVANTKVKVTSNRLSSGIFLPGTIQYCFTYFNSFSQETSIFHTTPILYTTFNDRGGNPEEAIYNSFTIDISGINPHYEYIRIYSLQRSSIDGTPYTKRVCDLPIDSTKAGNLNYKISYTDDGESGDVIDYTELLHLGGEPITAETLEFKDNTLFLGNISINNFKIDEDIQNSLKVHVQDVFTYKHKPSNVKIEPTSYYGHDNQLTYPVDTIKTFKYLETYRFGLQFQHITGKWSEPVWVGDFRNEHNNGGTKYTTDTQMFPGLIQASCTLPKNIENTLIGLQYTKVRPVIVYPGLLDRECVCQGILCPTVYNVEDRYNNVPFAQSSWFTRPNLQYDISSVAPSYPKDTGIHQKEWYDRDYKGTDTPSTSINSRAGVVLNEATYDADDFKQATKFLGAWLEARNNYPIPNNDQKNAEIQSSMGAKKDLNLGDLTSYTPDIAELIVRHKQNFAVDQSIITMHSPDIEFDDKVQTLNTSGLHLRILGIVPITAFNSGIDIQTKTPPGNVIVSSTSEVDPETEEGIWNYGGPAHGFYNPKISAVNTSRFGARALMSGCFWADQTSNVRWFKSVNNPAYKQLGYVTYAFHRNGSLNNAKNVEGETRPSVLDKKKIYNSRYSTNTHYFQGMENIWYALKQGSSTCTGITTPIVVTSQEVTKTVIPSPKYSNLEDMVYYGNIDKVITVKNDYNERPLDGDHPFDLINVAGYPICVGYYGGGKEKVNNVIRPLPISTIFSAEYKTIADRTDILTEDVYVPKSMGVLTQNSLDPISMKYKSTPHIVMALNYTEDGAQKILPTLVENQGKPINNRNIQCSNPYFWKNATDTTVQDVIDYNFAEYHGCIQSDNLGPEYAWLWLGELYNPNIINRFGGDSEEALANNSWIPCGEAVTLLTRDAFVAPLEINWTEGDTYYQRYDHIKTYPFTLEDQNAITDVVSFMCETRVNIDGRYDKNRNPTDYFAITPNNFNKINMVYSQTDNFFNYRIFEKHISELKKFKTTVTWTKTKTLGELTDTWTNISMASVLDMDGNKGDIAKIILFNNNLYCFQEKGISVIKFNANAQIATTEGLPVELGNSGKVDGKDIIMENKGCNNHRHICKTSEGIYFIDSNNKNINYLGQGNKDLTSSLGFKMWADKNIKDQSVKKDNMTLQYDQSNGEILFINKDNCLAYSEALQAFTSFYSHENIPYFINLGGNSFSTKLANGETQLYQQNAGDYCNFYGNPKDFSVTYRVNPEPTLDKTFNVVEFRSDIYNSGGGFVSDDFTHNTFNKLEIWNEYQRGESTLVFKKAGVSNLKRKFRIWRADVPRENGSIRRIRSPWATIKLTKDTATNHKTVLHDVVVHYSN